MNQLLFNRLKLDTEMDNVISTLNNMQEKVTNIVRNIHVVGSSRNLSMNNLSVNSFIQKNLTGKNFKNFWTRLFENSNEITYNQLASDHIEKFNSKKAAAAKLIGFRCKNSKTNVIIKSKMHQNTNKILLKNRNNSTYISELDCTGSGCFTRSRSPRKKGISIEGAPVISVKSRNVVRIKNNKSVFIKPHNIETIKYQQLPKIPLNREKHLTIN